MEEAFFTSRGFHGLHVLIGTLFLIFSLFRAVLDNLWQSYYIDCRNQVYFAWLFLLCLWCMSLGVLFFLSIEELVQKVTRLGVGRGGSIPPTDPQAAFVCYITLLHSSEDKIESPFTV